MHFNIYLLIDFCNILHFYLIIYFWYFLVTMFCQITITIMQMFGEKAQFTLNKH